MHYAQERLEVGRPLVLARQEQAPARPQGREQQQVGLILRQDDATARQVPDSPANVLLFSPATPGPAPAYSATASRRTLADPIPGGRYRPRAAAPCSVPGALAAAARSTPWRSSRDPGVRGPGEVRVTGRDPSRSTESVGLVG